MDPESSIESVVASVATLSTNTPIGVDQQLPIGRITQTVGQVASAASGSLRQNGSATAGSLLQSASAGAAVGASIGSVIPGLGTAIGGAVGAGVGLIADGWRDISRWLGF
jgi:urocanate hydratase